MSMEVRQFARSRTLRRMFSRWFASLAVFNMGLLTSACDDPSAGLSQVLCRADDKGGKLDVATSEVRIERRLEVDSDVPDELHVCLPAPRPLYSTVLPFVGAPGTYYLHVTAPHPIQLHDGVQTDSRSGEPLCEWSGCTDFSPSYTSEESDLGAGGDSSCAEGCSMLPYENGAVFTVAEGAVSMIRFVSASPMTVQVRVVPRPSQE